MRRTPTQDPSTEGRTVPAPGARPRHAPLHAAHARPLRHGGPVARPGPPKPSALVRFLPDFQYLLEHASGIRLLECGVLTCREA